jgi:hypothetical protein
VRLPFGAIEGDTLEIHFSTADFTIASVLAAIQEHGDKIEEMGVVFLGAQTEVPGGPSPVFRPVTIRAVLQYEGSGDPQPVLERSYRVVWQGITSTFPNEAVWAQAKEALSHYVVAQADLLRARAEVARAEGGA